MTQPIPDAPRPDAPGSNAPMSHPVAITPRPKPSLLRRAMFPVGMLAATAGVFWLMAGHALSHGDLEKLPPEPAPASNNPKAVAVTLAPVELRRVQRTVEVVGTLSGYEEVTLRAKVEGHVKRLRHDVSDRLAPGEAIVELDPTDAELTIRQAEKNLLIDLARLGLSEPPAKDFDARKVPIVAQAQARLDNARAKSERATTLSKRSVVSSEEQSERLSEYRAAEAELANQLLVANAGLATIQMRQESLAIARKALDDTVIRVPVPSKPIPGMDSPEYTMTKRSLSEGAFVRAGDEVCRLVIDRTLKLKVAVPERFGPEVKLGQKASVVTASSMTPVTGEVSRINPAVDPTTRTIEVEILCDNSRGKLKPGGFAKAQIATRLDEQAPTVPLEALVTFAGISKIFVADGDHVHELKVELGVQDVNWVEIASPDLSAGSKVVTSGQTALTEGSAIFVRKTDPDQTAKRPDVKRRESTD